MSRAQDSRGRVRVSTCASVKLAYVIHIDSTARLWWHRRIAVIVDLDRFPTTQGQTHTWLPARQPLPSRTRRNCATCFAVSC
eukprot:5693247-Amphidinium_carterae.1